MEVLSRGKARVPPRRTCEVRPVSVATSQLKQCIVSLLHGFTGGRRQHAAGASDVQLAGSDVSIGKKVQRMLLPVVQGSGVGRRVREPLTGKREATHLQKGSSPARTCSSISSSNIILFFLEHQLLFFHQPLPLLSEYTALLRAALLTFIESIFYHSIST